MAALAVSASISASAFCGQKLAVKNNVKAAPAKAVRFTAPRAKYGDESVYFDLKDLGNTTGAWDLYGNDGASPYNGLQAKFFETFAGLFTKRGILLKVLILGYAGAIANDVRDRSYRVFAQHFFASGGPLPSVTGSPSHFARVARHRRSASTYASLADVHAVGASASRPDASDDVTAEYLDPLFIPELEVVEVAVAGRVVRVVQPRCLDTVLDMYIAREAESGEHKDPYWCQVWPCAQAMFRQVLAHPETVQGQRVCDLGAGIGIAGLAALMAGAREVVYFDREPLALLSCLLTSIVNAHNFPQYTSSQSRPCFPSLRLLQQWLTSAQQSGALKHLLSLIALPSYHLQHRHVSRDTQFTESPLDHSQLSGSSDLSHLHLPALEGSQVSLNGAVLITETASISAEVLDWSDGDYHGEKFNTVLACDVLYDSSASSLLPRLLPNLLRQSSCASSDSRHVIVMDPTNRFPANREVFLRQMSTAESLDKSVRLRLRNTTSTSIESDGTNMPVEVIHYSG
ncbi:unnamed protein product [Closterium sp. Yama58-4]|nr:unnamed protein product [Closterium sp. Yama58-4]